MTYKHTQRGTVVLVAMTIAAAVVLWIGLRTTRSVLAAVPFLAVIGWLFRSLTIEVTDAELRWWFGSGLIHKKVLLSDIAAVKVVPTGFWDGWGIHYTRYGWLYNVSGTRAIAITLKTGKRFAIGTDEPEKVAAILGAPVKRP